MVDNHIFPWKCGFYNSCPIQGRNHIERKLAFGQDSLSEDSCVSRMKDRVIVSLTFIIPIISLKSCSIEYRLHIVFKD